MRRGMFIVLTLLCLLVYKVHGMDGIGYIASDGTSWTIFVQLVMDDTDGDTDTAFEMYTKDVFAGEVPGRFPTTRLSNRQIELVNAGLSTIPSLRENDLVSIVFIQIIPFTNRNVQGFSCVALIKRSGNRYIIVNVDV